MERQADRGADRYADRVETKQTDTLPEEAIRKAVKGAK